MGCLRNGSKGVALQTPQQPTSPSMFTYFAKLAPEIRLVIWRLAVLEPRILELELLGHGRWKSPTPSSSIVPSILQTCNESRQEALKTYHQLGVGVWINFSIDTIYVRIYQNHIRADITLGEEFLGLLQTNPLLKRLRSLALWSDTWHEYIHTRNRYMVLEALPELVELSIIDSDDGLSPDKEGIGFDYWSEGSEVTFEEFPEYGKLSGDERVTQDSERRYGPQAGWLAEDPYPDRHYLSYDPPEFKFRTARRAQPAPWVSGTQFVKGQ
jgi:hypothetical protein